jgi:hypothetical protein
MCQSAWRSPETRAGPAERIGFIEAPEMGPPNIASSPTVQNRHDHEPERDRDSDVTERAGLSSSTMIAPAPANTNANVPTNSAASSRASGTLS